MAAREDYLKRYFESSFRKKNKKRLKKRSNLAVYDDDIDWRWKQSEVEENDPDEAPVIAEIQDDTINKWQPVTSIRDEGKQKRKRMDSPDLSPKRKQERSSLCRTRSSSSDLSPQRGEILSREGKHRIVSSTLQNRQQTRRGHSPCLNDHSPRGQHLEHGSNKSSQGSNCLFSVTVSKEPSNVPLRETKEIKMTAKDSESLHHKYADVTAYDFHTETIYRDKEGHKIDPKLQACEKERKERFKQDEKFISWKRGVTQSKSAHEKLYDDLYEMSKPLARYAEDEDLERRLKERDRDGDPMLAFIKKTRKVKMEERGLPQKGFAPPNRYGIKPGYRWDGVDRSNGFERMWFINESSKKAFNEEAYKWSVEDM